MNDYCTPQVSPMGYVAKVEEELRHLKAENARLTMQNDQLKREADHYSQKDANKAAEIFDLKEQLTAMQRVVDEYGELIFKINSNLGTDWVHKLARCLPDKETTK